MKLRVQYKVSLPKNHQYLKYVLQFGDVQSTKSVLELKELQNSMISQLIGICLAEKNVDFLCYSADLINEQTRGVYVFVIARNESFQKVMEFIQQQKFSCFLVYEEVLDSLDFIRANMQSIISSHVKYSLSNMGRLYSKDLILLEYLFKCRLNHYYTYFAFDSFEEAKEILLENSAKDIKNKEVVELSRTFEKMKTSEDDINRTPSFIKSYDINNLVQEDHRYPKLLANPQIKISEWNPNISNLQTTLVNPIEESSNTMPEENSINEYYIICITAVVRIGVVKFRFVESQKEWSKLLLLKCNKLLDFKTQEIKDEFTEKKNKKKKSASNTYIILNMPFEIGFRSRYIFLYLIKEVVSCLRCTVVNPISSIKFTCVGINYLPSNCDKIFFFNRMNSLNEATREHLNSYISTVIERELNKTNQLLEKLLSIFSSFTAKNENVDLFKKYSIIQSDEIKSEADITHNSQLANTEISMLTFFGVILNSNPADEQAEFDQHKAGSQLQNSAPKERLLKDFCLDEILIRSKCKTDFGLNEKISECKRIEIHKGREEKIHQANNKLKLELIEEFFKYGYIKEKKLQKVKFAIKPERQALVKSIKDYIGLK